MSVLTRALPTRILLVDDDELELELIADRLASAGFEVRQATNGADALRLLEERWYPVIVTDWQMPIMDGLTLCETIRARGIDAYVIMLTTREASADYERGYAAGIDDYLTKKVPDSELFARINAAFNTLALRRSLREAREALEQSASHDSDSGAFAPRELSARLRGEIARAERYDRPLSVITVGVRAARAEVLPTELLREIAETLARVVRAHVDWVGRVESLGEAAFAVVLPEASISDGPAIKERLMNALLKVTGSEHQIALTFGLAALERGGSGAQGVEPSVMLAAAEHCRACSGRIGAEQLEAVKHSVTGHVAIACRHGYAIASECPLQSRERRQ
jgi:PleD family two-component response regulator